MGAAEQFSRVAAGSVSLTPAPRSAGDDVQCCDYSRLLQKPHLSEGPMPERALCIPWSIIHLCRISTFVCIYFTEKCWNKMFSSPVWYL